MDLITLIAVLLIVVGVVALIAGMFIAEVPPGATRLGWGLLLLGVLLLIIGLVVDEADVHNDHADLTRSSWSEQASFGPLGIMWLFLHERRVLRRPVRMHPRS